MARASHRVDRRDRRVERGGGSGDSKRNRDDTRRGKESAGRGQWSGSVIGGEYADGNIRGVVFIAGKRGSGKSFLQLRELGFCNRDRVVFDTLGQYGHQRGYIPVHSPHQVKGFMLGRLKVPGGHPLRILYQPIGGDLEQHFEAVTALVLAYGKNGPGVIYAVDEIDRFCSASYVPPSMKDLINYGRHRKVSMICTSRRPAAVARELTSQAAEIRVFRTTEPRDIRYFADIMGDTAANRLPSLGEYQYLRWTDDCAEPEIRGGKI